MNAKLLLFIRCLLLYEVGGNGDKCPSDGEIFLINLTYTSLLLLSVVFLLIK